MKNNVLAVSSAFLLGDVLLLSNLPLTFFCVIGLALALALVFSFRRHEDEDPRNILAAKYCYLLLIGLSFSWFAAVVADPGRTPVELLRKERQRHTQEVKAENERLERLSLIAPNLDKDFNRMNITVTVISPLEPVVGRLYIFRGLRSDDKTERLIFYEMPESHCMETNHVPSKGDKMPIMIKTFRSGSSWLAPLGHYSADFIFLAKNSCQ